MKLTSALIDRLHRVFDKDPAPFLALRLRYAGTGMTWRVSEGFLTTAPTGGVGSPLSVDLAPLTLSGLAAYLATRPGYTVEGLDTSRAGLSAMVLLDGAGDQAVSNGDHLFGFTSLLWSFMLACARALTELTANVALAPAMMATVTAEGEWLDQLGGYYNTPRRSGESDAAYGPRIIAETVRPTGNNVAIERALEAALGCVATVTDVDLFSSAYAKYDGSFNHDGSHVYDTVAHPYYGVFDVALAGVGAGGTAAIAAARPIIAAMRHAGTHMRNITASA